MDNNSIDGVPSNDSIRELFGPPPPRRPIPSNSFNALVKIFSLFSDQNPFSECVSYAQIPEYSKQCVDNPNDSRRLLSDDIHSDVVVPRGEKEASNGLAGFDSVGDHDVNSEGISGDFSNDIGLSGSKLILDELGRENKNKTLEKVPYDEEGTGIERAEVDKVHAELSGIERILMDESDNFDVLQQPDKDADFDFLNDFSCILDTDVCVNKSMTVESNSSEKLIAVDRNTKEDAAGEKKRKDVEVNLSTSGGDGAKTHTHLPVVREISDCQEVVNQSVGTCPGEGQRKKRKLCKEKAPQDLSEFGGLTFAAQKSNNAGGTVSNSITKGNKVGVAAKEKTKKVKDTFHTSAKDVNSGKSKLLVVSGETSYNMKSGDADPIVRGKMAKQNTKRKDGNARPKTCVKFHYSREELLNLRKITSFPEDILKLAREMDAEVHGKYQKSAAGKLTDVGGAKKEKLSTSTEDKMTEEEGSSILKHKKRGTSSEARKEKKKQKRRKKRAEMNKKHGIKRLILTPIVKPKVIQPCRHYLNGRCQEGEKCKFSHDVVPLTKSKPCCHFARQACMKGDDCPYDHQLSKYPCNSFVTTGFCNRGDICLFSHKISAKEGSETAAAVSKCEATSLDQLDKSNSKQLLNAKASFSSGIVATQTSHQAKAPKGLSFLPSGKSSSPKDSVGGGADAGTITQPNTATTAFNLIKGLIDTPASDTPQGTDFISIVKSSVGNLGDKKQASPLLHRDNSRFCSFGKSGDDSSHRSVDTAGTSSQLNKGIMPSRVQSVCRMLETNPAPLSPKNNSNGPFFNRWSCSKQISVPSSGGPPYDNSGGKSQVDSQIREKESANGSEKAAIQPKLWDSPTSGQCSTKAVGVKNTPSTSQRALLSALSFAAKYESGIKMTTSAGSAKEVTKNEGKISSDSGCKQNEPSKASAILEFLYSGGNKEK
ncbi:hypothetical protein SOVF_079940 isoform A [Spinacia oleracea]|uniref:Uncharacterized protein isoform X1 n=1 Tax=Spinacia oleracea TaxID=3562 RepID=A0A9R0HW83_SPIOL|nr:uncharacterized protein LOC110777653 isoform X1 [Spinacia oleracea]KNA17439.1 hypothetical protein SOVF_079940 isoform A [Spinacia oleracea]